MARQTITPDNLDDLEVDEKGQLYWRGEPIVTDARLALSTFQSLLAGTVGLAAFLGGLGSCVQGVIALLHYLNRCPCS
jgi:hypothetical protein